MTDDNSRDRLFKAVRERIKKSDEQDRIQMITNAIGDRRYRDLVDLVARIEGEDGWSTALEFLISARSQKYFSPLTIGQDRTCLEPLKYREMIFELLSCNGLEPVTTDTTTLLKNLDSESSLIDASSVLFHRLEKSAVEQIEAGDTLFFDFSENTSFAQEILTTLNKIRREKIHSISLQRSENLINIEPLWYSEYGRLALSSLGVKGNTVDSNTLDSVLSVIQIPLDSGTMIKDVPSRKDFEKNTFTHPSNDEYRKLHTHLINHEIGELSLLASRHSVPQLNALLDEVSSTYEDKSSTIGYKETLDHINAHIAIRSVESILVLEKSAQMKNTRIATTAILAIGNFYHESSAAVLVKMLCDSKNDEKTKVVTKAIENVYKKCPEADRIITDILDTDCRNRGKLKKLYRRLNKEKHLYYQ